MLSPSHFLRRSLLLAGAVALPLFGGAIAAETTPAPTTAAVTATTSAGPAAVAADKTVMAKPGDKQLGALKATPAEKKAAHDKMSAGEPTTGLGKQQAHLVKPAPTAANSGAADAAKPAAP